jgi:uncharacterized protein (DUF433 family)
MRALVPEARLFEPCPESSAHNPVGQFLSRTTSAGTIGHQLRWIDPRQRLDSTRASAKSRYVWHTQDVISPPSVLDRELYSEQEAARLLGLPPSTLHYWLEGGIRRGVVYAPIIRPEATGRRWVSWAEFIEAGWLSTYRRRKGVPMPELRAFISDLRDKMGVPYPLAHHRPLVSGRQLVQQAQEEAGLEPDFQLVVAVGKQLMLSYPGQRFVERVVWEGDLAVGWKPHDLGSPVTVRPDVRFGRPAVAGVSTLSIFERSEEGASREEIAEDFEISIADVRWAIAYEEQQHAA